jgi:hypothetical protein
MRALILANMLVISVLLGCVSVNKDMVWSYGKYCGEDYPKDTGNTSQERIVHLGEETPVDDIDAACQQHDICYERHGRNHCLCDQLLLGRLLDMEFEGESKDYCTNVRGQAGYYFLSIHPSECSGIWMMRLLFSPAIGFTTTMIIPVAAIGQPHGVPKCDAIKPPKPGSYEHRQMARIVELNKNPPEITITGFSKKQIMEKFSGYMYERGHVLKRSDGSVAVYGKLDGHNKWAPTELGKDPPELRTEFFLKDTGGGVSILCTSQAYVINQDSDFEGVFELGVSDGPNREALQKLLYAFREKLKVTNLHRK